MTFRILQYDDHGTKMPNAFFIYSFNVDLKKYDIIHHLIKKKNKFFLENVYNLTSEYV